MTMEIRLHKNQARSYAAAIHQVARDTLASGNPADRILNAYFRDMKKLGSRDRRMIAETLFGLFRWWGWLRRIPASQADIWQRGREESPEWAAMLSLAYHLDHDASHPVALEWLQIAGLPDVPPMAANAPLAEKARVIGDLGRMAAPDAAALVPEWLRPQVALNDDAYLALLDYLQRRPPLWLRAQADRDALIETLRGEGLQPIASSALSQAICLEQARVNLFELESFRRGQFELQDAASQMIGLAAGAQPGERWWDACAGAGGKSLQLAAMMGNKGTVVASDIRAYKLDELRKRARRAGFSNIAPRAWEDRRLPVKAGSMDGVLVDAPCTGTGTWRRNPDSRWTTRADEVAEMAALQRDILSRAAKAVKPGGVLIYATCSLCHAENEATARAFLAEHADFAPEGWRNPLTGTPTSGLLQVWPMDANCDATFVARFRRARI